ncbi:MAG: MoaD/ThiS family protein [Halobacteriota archaeon]|nr:MoaD/ThiS family protein [Halobacteriota archaeon]
MVRLSIDIVTNERRMQSVDLPDDSTYEDLLSELDINQETVIVLSDGLPVPLDAKVSQSDITVLRVVSGG